jgi:HK97 gp10 family phage protein
MPARIEVKGLSRAKKNFEQLKTDVQIKLGRDALAQGALVIARAVRAATYTTFNRMSGAIRSGFSVRVARSPTGDAVLNSFIVQRQQSIAGTSPATALFRAHFVKKRQRSGSIKLDNVAFWWRFLEFGTGPRRASRTPSFLRKNKTATTKRQHAALARWSASPGRGGIKSRSWVRPALGTSADASVNTFRDVLLRKLAEETEQLPK